MINQPMLKKYAHLLVHFSLYLKKGEKLYISSTILAAPLIEEIQKEAIKLGAIVEVNLSLASNADMLLSLGTDEQLKYIGLQHEYCMEHFDAYLAIRAPFEEEKQNDYVKDAEKVKMRREALAKTQQMYFERLGNGTLKRSLCQYPTMYNAKLAEMTLDEYAEFVFNACKLYEDNPQGAWESLSKEQQKIADFLNTKNIVRYKNNKTDIEFSVEDRLWVNSDGKNNMPSGEVFSSPVEDSVNGYIHFDYPAVYNKHAVNGITLKVKDGEVYEWSADEGQGFLNEIFKIEGAKFFGEVAIGNNYNVKRATKNILFDEKIGGTVHMAIGQSYIQTGGKNKCSIHWDMIADMKNGGEIYADGELVYKNGRFIVAL